MYAGGPVPFQYVLTAQMKPTKVAEEFRLDPDRLYLTGCSMGGEGVWLLALELPQRFAAIAPICGDAPEEINVKRVAKIKVGGHGRCRLGVNCLIARSYRRGLFTVDKTQWCLLRNRSKW